MNVRLFDAVVLLIGTLWGMAVFAACVGYAEWRFIMACKEIVDYHIRKRMELVLDLENRVTSDAGPEEVVA